MGKLFVQIRKQPTAGRFLVGMGAFVVLAMVVMYSAGNAEAAVAGPHITKLSGNGDNSRILLAAKDTPKADVSGNDARASGGKAAKDRMRLRTVNNNNFMDYDWETNDWAIPLQIVVSKTAKAGKIPVKLELEVNYYVE
jgi:hypothetical protein